MTRAERAAKARGVFIRLHRGGFDRPAAYAAPYDAAERTYARQGRWILRADWSVNRDGFGPFDAMERLQTTADKMRRLWDRLSAP